MQSNAWKVSGAPQYSKRYAIELTGDDFSGAWYSPEYNTLVVAVTDSVHFGTLKAIGSVPVLHDYSLQELEREKRKISHHSRKNRVSAQGIGAWYVDMVSNSLVIEHLPGNRSNAESLISKLGIRGVPVQLRPFEEFPILLNDVRGGDEFYNTTQGFPCSIGFSVNEGYLTAGHCGDNGDDVDGHNSIAQGKYEESDWSTTDRAWVKVNVNWTPKPIVNGYGQGTLSITGDLAGLNPSPVNSTVCRYGRTTDDRCGNVEAINVQNTFNGIHTLFGLTRTTACADGGDSGGPFLSSSGYYAQGTTVGGQAGTCPNAAFYMYFEPAEGALSQYGKILLTSHGANAPSMGSVFCFNHGYGAYSCTLDSYDSQGSTSVSWSSSTGHGGSGMTMQGSCSSTQVVNVTATGTNPYGSGQGGTSFTCSIGPPQ